MGGNRGMMKKCIVSIIGMSISWTFNVEDYKYRHAILNHISNATTSLNPIEIDPGVGPLLALAYSEQGRWRDAEMLQVAVMENRKQLLGDDHPKTLTSMGSLANIYRNQGRWKDAEVLEVVVMEKMKQRLGSDHPDTLTIRANLQKSGPLDRCQVA